MKRLKKKKSELDSSANIKLRNAVAQLCGEIENQLIVIKDTSEQRCYLKNKLEVANNFSSEGLLCECDL